MMLIDQDCFVLDWEPDFLEQGFEWFEVDIELLMWREQILERYNKELQKYLSKSLANEYMWLKLLSAFCFLKPKVLSNILQLIRGAHLLCPQNKFSRRPRFVWKYWN